ncbi:MAG: diguanylate cyclase [Lachnospiraceae bacterium]|nr:diguanylate cyclase [Lachnospiraceae bacterium]
MNTKSNGKISYVIQAIGILPLLFFGITITVLSFSWFTKIMYAEVENGLKNVALNTVTLLDITHPGDYTLEGDSAYRLFKGSYDLTYDYSLIDRVKEDTGFEITLFYQDTRILTTICNSEGTRIIGTGAPKTIIEEVFQTGESHFYSNIIINGNPYFAYYMPLFNEDGSIVGMLFAGKPSENVNLSIQSSTYPLAIMVLLALMIVVVCVFLYTRKVVIVLSKIHEFLLNISGGDLNVKLDPCVLRRNDELGDIGRSAQSMQRSLRAVVEQDPLTELFNRRSTNRKLLQIIDKSTKQQVPFCIALGDIDFFKHVNDTYGHDCGDLVLKSVAQILRQHMLSQGFAARWGGEEFLLIFDHTDLENAHASLSELMNKIHNLTIEYQGEIIKITMTFGLIPGNSTDIKQMIHAADEKLYQGKEEGRNRIIV